MREILEKHTAGESIRPEYQIVTDGALAGVGAHSYSEGARARAFLAPRSRMILHDEQNVCLLRQCDWRVGGRRRQDQVMRETRARKKLCAGSVQSVIYVRLGPLFD